MATITERMGLTIPAGTDFVERETIFNDLKIIEEKAALKTDVDSLDDAVTAVQANNEIISDAVDTLSTQMAQASTNIETIQAQVDDINNGVFGSNNGWISIPYTCIYTSATSFTITGQGDLTGKFQTGDKILLTQTTPKYFYLISISYNSGTDTNTFNIFAGSDYMLTNAAINEAYYSKILNPQGFPQFFNYVAVPTGASGFSILIHRFSLLGTQVTVYIVEAGGGLGNANTYSIPAPLTSRNVVNMINFALAFTSNNGAASTQLASIAANSATIELLYNLDPNGWAASGTRVAYLTITYEI